MKKAFIVSGVFISGLIGAGFASGSEILFYFSKYSKAGFFGTILCAFIFSFVLYAVTLRSAEMNIRTADKYFFNIMNKPLAILSTVISYGFMLVILCSMFSGFGELLLELFCVKKSFGVTIMMFLTHLIISGGYKSFTKVQSFLSIIIIFSILLFGLYIIFFRELYVNVFKPEIKWSISSISYSSYNLLTAIPVLCILSDECDKKTAKKTALITFFELFPILVLLYSVICIYYGKVSLGTMPLLTIAMRQSKIIGYLYSITIFVSMLTTAVSGAYALSSKISEHIPKRTANLITVTSAFFLSGFDFEFIVDKLYRYIGIVSIFILLFISKDFLKKMIY